MHSSIALAFGLSTLSAVFAVPQGFNYAANFQDGTAKQQSDFKTEFTNAKSLAGTDGAFTSARIYTMIVSHFRSQVKLCGGINDCFFLATRHRQ